MTIQHSPQNATGFSLRLLNHACDGVATLRDALIAKGVPVATLAHAAEVSVRTLQKATNGGRTRRGVLVRLAGLAVILDQLSDEGIPVSALWAPHTTHARAVIHEISGQSPIAAKLVTAMSTAPQSGQEQLQLPMAA